MDIPGPLIGYSTGLYLVGECLLLFVLLDVTLQWGGDQDPLMTYVTFWFGTRHGRCSRAVAGGFEMSVLDPVNVRSIAGFGCESLEGVSCTGFVVRC